MHILLTNDDGCDAPGLRAAFEALRTLGTVHVVAPHRECSACSHTITLRREIQVERTAHDDHGRVFRVEGTPADCVRLAVAELIDEPIDLVVSGINRGANAGVDTFYSGTVAAAREAAFLGIKAVAISQAIRKEVDVDWPAASAVSRRLIEQLVQEPWPAAAFYSINLPSPIPPDAIERAQRVPVATHSAPLSFDRSDNGDGRMTFTYGAPYWSRDAAPSTDYGVVRDGGIAISEIPLVGSS